MPLWAQNKTAKKQSVTAYDEKYAPPYILSECSMAIVRQKLTVEVKKRFFIFKLKYVKSAELFLSFALQVGAQLGTAPPPASRLTTLCVFVPLLGQINTQLTRMEIRPVDRQMWAAFNFWPQNGLLSPTA